MSATAGAIRGGLAYVQAFLDDNPVTQGLAKLQGKLRRFQASLSTLAAGTMGGEMPEPLGAIARFAASPAGAFAALGAAAKHTAEARAAMLELSETTGVGVEKLSKYAYAARSVGLSTETLGGALRKMRGKQFAAAFQAAAGGMKGATAAAFQAMGKGDAADRLREFIRLAESMPPEERIGLAKRLGISELLPLINQGVGALDAFTRSAEELGLVVSREDAEAGKQFRFAFGDMMEVIDSCVQAIGGALVPILTSFTNLAVRVTAVVRDWLKNHQTLTQILFYGAAAIVADGIALKALSLVIGVVSQALGGIRMALQGINLVLALNPWVLLVAGLAAAAAYVANAMGLFDGLKQKLREFFDGAGEIFGGIADALGAGKIELAGQIAIAGLKWAWFAGLDAMNQATGGWVATIGKYFVKLVRTIGELWNSAVAGIARGLLSLAERYPAIGKAMGIEVQSGAELKAKAVGQARSALAFAEQQDPAQLGRNAARGVKTYDWQIEQLEKDKAVAEAGGDTRSAKDLERQIAEKRRIKAELEKQIANGDYNEDAYRRRVEGLRKDAAAAAAKSEDQYAAEASGTAHAAVDDQAQAALDALEKKMDGWAQTAADPHGAAAAAKAELDRLREEAAAAAAKAKHAAKPAAGQDLSLDAQSAIAGTFSGAVAGMLGGGGDNALGLARKQADAAVDAVDLQRMLLDVLKAIVEKVPAAESVTAWLQGVL